MLKSYLSTLFLVITIASFGQESQIEKQVFISSANADDFIPVQRGDVFTVRTNIVSGKKRSTLTNVLKAIGLATATYQTGKLAQGAGKRNGPAGNTNMLLPLGIGITVGADKLIPPKSAVVYIKYFQYNTNRQFVSEEIVKVDNKLLKRGGLFSVSRAISADGFIRLFVVNKDGQTVADLADLVVNIQLGSPANPEKELAVSSHTDNDLPVVAFKNSTAPENTVDSKMATPDLPAAPQFIKAGVVALVANRSRPIQSKDHPIAVKQITHEQVSVSSPSIPQTEPNILTNRQGKLNVGTKLPAKKYDFPFTIPLFIVPRVIKVGEEEGGEEDVNLPVNKGLDSMDDDEEGDGGGYYEGGGYYGGGNDDEGVYNGDFDEGGDDGNDGGSEDDNYFVWTDPETGEEYLYYIPLGDSTDIGGGITVYHNFDGSFTVEYSSDSDVTVTSSITVQRSGSDVLITGIAIGADSQATVISAINLSTKLESLLASLGTGVGVVSIVAGGVPAALNLLRDLFNGNKINTEDLVSLGIAILAAFALYGGFVELGIFLKLLIDLIISVGGSVWDIWSLLH